MRGRRRSFPMMSAARSSGSTARRGDSAAGSTWRDTASVWANTSTSRRPFPTPWRRSAPTPIPIWPPSPTAGSRRWRAGPATRRILVAFLRVCAAQGQTKPTPLLLRYKAGGYNCLHRDLYGAVAFPLQMTWALSRRGVDFEGGESLLVEQRPRAQSRGEVIALERGEALVFPTNYRPVRGGPRVSARGDAARREPDSFGGALHARDHLSRRGLSAAVRCWHSVCCSPESCLVSGGGERARALPRCKFCLIPYGQFSLSARSITLSSTPNASPNWTGKLEARGKFFFAGDDKVAPRGSPTGHLRRTRMARNIPTGTSSSAIST